MKNSKMMRMMSERKTRSSRKRMSYLTMSLNCCSMMRKKKRRTSGRMKRRRK